METETLDNIVKEFAEQLRDRQFFGANYGTYIFSLKTDEEHSIHELILEASEASFLFNDKNGYPIPLESKWSLKIPAKKYLIYKYVRGGSRISFKTILKDHKAAGGDPFLTKDQIEHWEDQPVYFCGYEFEKNPLVVVLVFDLGPNKSSTPKPAPKKKADKAAEKRNETRLTTQIAENELLTIYLNPIFKRVEDEHHKKSIFNKDYLFVLQKQIDDSLFSPIKESIDGLKKDMGQSHYLQRVYYNFIIDNFSIYKQLEAKHQDKLLALSKEFERHQKNLFRIPNYRDHFLHQFNVYILGVAFISVIHGQFFNNMVEHFNNSYSPEENHKYKDIHDVCVIWFLTSMFHDIANPVEKSGKWLDAFFQEYVYPSKHGKPLLKTNINLSRVIADTDYSNCFEELAEYHRKLNVGEKGIDYESIADDTIVSKGCEIRSMIFDQTIRNRDHGILSSIMLLHKFRMEKEILRFLFPAAAAISIHDFLWIDDDIFDEPCIKCSTFDCESCTKWKGAYNEYFKKWKKFSKSEKDNFGNLRYISYERDPVGFLLILSDSLQDWGRHDVDYPAQAYDPFYNPSALSALEVEGNKIVFEIKIKASPCMDKKTRALLFEKRKYIAKIFSRLRFIEGHDFVVRFHLPDEETLEFSMNFFSR